MRQLVEIFKEYNYTDVLQQEYEQEVSFSLDSFMEEDGNKPSELKNIFMSSGKDELFIILDGRDKNLESFSRDWDGKISFFINHGFENIEERKRLQFNIVQIILYDEKEETTINKMIEKSLLNSRKILVKANFQKEELGYDETITDIEVNEIIQLEEEEKYSLPFVLIDQNDREIDLDLKKTLESLLPKEEKKYDFLTNEIRKKRNGSNESKMSLTDQQYKIIEEWIRLQ